MKFYFRTFKTTKIKHKIFSTHVVLNWSRVKLSEITKTFWQTFYTRTILITKISQTTLHVYDTTTCTWIYEWVSSERACSIAEWLTPFARWSVVGMLRPPRLNHLHTSIVTVNGEADVEHKVARQNDLQYPLHFLPPLLRRKLLKPWVSVCYLLRY